MADVLGKVLSAFVASGVLVPLALLKDRHTAGVEIRSTNDEAVFLEDLVQLYVPPDPRTVTIRNERVVFIGWCARPSLYAAAHQVVHAGDEVPPASVPLPETPPQERAPPGASPLLWLGTLRPGLSIPALWPAWIAASGE
jgi:hypothetical protein